MPRQLVMIVTGLALGLLAVAPGVMSAQSVTTNSEWPEGSGAFNGFQDNANSQHKINVSGVVVNSITGVGVMKALVQIQGRKIVPVFTGADGRFEVDDLPEGPYTFIVRKPGYFSEQDLNNGMVPGPMIEESGQNPAEVRLKLTPEATVSGRVVDGGGEPIESASIQLMLQTIENGRKTWRPGAQGQTDDNGEFSLTGLRPGDYALRGSMSDGAEPRLEGQNYDTIYPEQYYGGAPSRDQATILHISGGQSVQADLTLKKAKGYRISGEVSGVPPGQNANLVLEDASDSAASAWAATGEQGRFTFHGVAPGAHMIQAVSQGQGQSMAFGEASVSVEQSDVKNVAIGLEPAFQIPVQVEVTQTHAADGGGNQPTGVQQASGGAILVNGGVPPLGYLNLVPSSGESFQNRGSVSVALQPSATAAEPMELKNVLPGKYHVEIALNHGGTGAFYVESAHAGDTDLLTSDLTVSETAGSPSIRIGVRDDGATLDITVAKGESQRMVALLISSTTGSEPMLVYMGGRFQYAGLAPGDYRVYAFDSIAGLEYANPEALREFVGKSQAVSLAANQSADVTVDVIHRGAP